MLQKLNSLSDYERLLLQEGFQAHLLKISIKFKATMKTKTY